jgi:IclR family transcriptional regulator, KDG regulon repressor
MSGSPSVLSSVQNAVRLLKQFSAQEREFGVSELARRMDLSKSTVHRLLVTLTEENLVEQSQTTGRYRLGLAVYDLGAAVATGLDLHEAVIGPMEQLRAASGETVHVAVLDGREVVYVDRLESPNTMKLFIEVGRRNWAHSTATGKCLLANISDVDLARILDGWRLPALTSRTITDPDALKVELKETRKRGYSINRGESALDVLSVAAPIRDGSGKLRAALSVAGPLDRLEPLTDRFGLAVREMATLASRRLGWVPR